jgi:hypothetical protein
VQGGLTCVASIEGLASPIAAPRPRFPIGPVTNLSRMGFAIHPVEVIPRSRLLDSRGTQPGLPKYPLALTIQCDLHAPAMPHQRFQAWAM